MGAQLDTVGKALDGWQAKSEEERRCTDWFKTYCSSFTDESRLITTQLFRTMEEELVKLRRLSEEWMVRKVADYEDEKTRIAEIFERVNEARVQFEVLATTTTFSQPVSPQYSPLFSLPSVSESSRVCIQLRKASGFVRPPLQILFQTHLLNRDTSLTVSRLHILPTTSTISRAKKNCCCVVWSVHSELVSVYWMASLHGPRIPHQIAHTSTGSLVRLGLGRARLPILSHAASSLPATPTTQLS